MGGVWSTPGISSNNNWIQQTPNIFSYYDISSIATHPSNSGIVYFATGKLYGNVTDKPGAGIFKSIDHGQTWNLVYVTDPSTNGNITACITKIEVALNGDVFVATASRGAPWNAIRTGIYILNADNTSLDPFIGTDNKSSKGFDIERAKNGDMWVSCFDNPTSPSQRALYKCRWNSFTSLWMRIPQASSGSIPINDDINRVELACAPNDENVVYAFYYLKTGGVDVYKTINGESSGLATSQWTLCSNPQSQVPNIIGSQPGRDLSIVVDPNNKDIVYIGCLKVAKGVFS